MGTTVIEFGGGRGSEQRCNLAGASDEAGDRAPGQILGGAINEYHRET